VDAAGVFQEIPRIEDSRLAEIFAREVLGFLVRKELLSPEWAERILYWRHTGFNVHSLVRTKTKPEAERVGKYMIRPMLALERLTFLEPEGKVGYRWGRDGAGRVMSRHEALRRFRGEQIRDELAAKGIELRSTNWKGVAEEAAAAYKDVDEDVRVSHELGIGRLVAKVVPIGVMKG